MESYNKGDKFHNINNVINLQEIFPQYDLYIIDCIYRRFNNFEKTLQYLFDNRTKLNVLFPDCRNVVEKYYSLKVAVNAYKKVLIS